jgi:hypothetical protein
MSNPRPGTAEWDQAAEANHKRVRAAIGGNAEDGSPLSWEEHKKYEALSGIYVPPPPPPNETPAQSAAREETERNQHLARKIRADLGVPHSDQRELTAAEYSAWRAQRKKKEGW